MVKDNVRRLHRLLVAVETVMLTTIDDRYRLISRPMTLQVDDDLPTQGALHLFAPAPSRVITHIAARAAVNVSFVSPTRSVSLSGTADFTTAATRSSRPGTTGSTRGFPVARPGWH